jgi:hypothetical protein
MLRVKLLYDYTKYNDKLEKGIEGFAFETPEEQVSRSASDKFVKVKFEGITDVDVPWRGLEILDEDYLKFAAEQEEIKKAAYFETIVSAEHVICTYGPKGGLRELKFEYALNGETQYVSITDKISGEEHLAFFKNRGISVKVINLEKKERKKR